MYYIKKAKNAEEIQAGIKKQLAKDRLEISYNPRAIRQKKKTIDLSIAKKGVSL